MKTIVSLLIVACLAACATSDKDNVKEAQNKDIDISVDKKVSKFLAEAVDARMMDIAQGKLAMERGVTPDVKAYGELMVKDQTEMLSELRTLAASKNIKLSTKLSDEKSDGLEDLKKQKGYDFDEKFVKMMIIDHRRDVKDFEKATEFKDEDVRKFADTYLPIVESHLDKIKDLKQRSKVAES